MNGYFGDPPPFPHHLANQLVVKFEAGGLHRGVNKERTAERLLASFVVGKLLPGQHVRDPDDEEIADIVVEVR